MPSRPSSPLAIMLAHRAHRRIERVGVADDQMDLVPLDRRDDRVAIGERQRHRLFEDDVLAVLGREHARARRGTGAASRCRRPRPPGRRTSSATSAIGAGVEVAREGLARPGMGVGRGPQHVARVGRRGLHHHRAGHAEAGDAEPEGGP